MSIQPRGPSLYVQKHQFPLPRNAHLFSSLKNAIFGTSQRGDLCGAITSSVSRSTSIAGPNYINHYTYAYKLNIYVLNHIHPMCVYYCILNNEYIYIIRDIIISHPNLRTFLRAPSCVSRRPGPGPRPGACGSPAPPRTCAGGNDSPPCCCWAATAARTWLEMTRKEGKKWWCRKNW